MNIFVIGHTGRLGSQLISMGCQPLDIDISKEKIRIDLDPKENVIINCAAKTAVDACEEKDNKYYWQAAFVNGYGVKYLAESWHGKIIHISSDYVFGGKTGPYSEDDLVSDKGRKLDDLPTRQMSYGVTKMMGESFAYQYMNVNIVRTTGLYGGVSPKNNFLNMILDNYKFGVEEILVTKELKGNQTYVPHLAEALIQCAQIPLLPKVLHIASRDIISRYEFALMIALVYNLDKSRLIPVRNDQVPGWVAERPKHGGLKIKLADKLGLPIYTILEGLEASKLANSN